ncbi:MAG: hypothetical protein SFU56_04530 [Capsulimonadales bacterium]|nr:hypothetical protein [Capsulimonadales bacterium]
MNWCRTGLAIAGSLVTFGLFCLPTFAAPTVGASGAVDGNLKWEQKTSSKWYIELQRYGLELIADGIANERDADIRKGILILDWGFARQAADGSFAGSEDIFHSTGIFLEAAAEAALLLKTYKPVTYAADLNYYAGKVSSYTSKLKAAARWMIQPSVAASGQAFDRPYTHRRYLSAAALGLIARLSGDTAIASAAASYIQAGLPLQLTGGTVNIAYPSGIRTIGLAGVNPEMEGFDVSYQAAGLRFAALYGLNGGLASLQPNLLTMLNRGLAWEATRVDVQGKFDVTGSTRVGIEKNRDGSVKQMNTGEAADAFAYAYQLTGSELYRVIHRRITKGTYVISTSKVTASGAVDSNSLFESKQSSTYAIDMQKLGVEYVMAGVDKEDPSQIAQGLKMIDWGFARQASDGSFPNTTSAFYNVAQFIEAAARITLMLKNYKPVTYKLSSSTYAGTITNYTNRVRLAANWLMRPDIASSGQKSIVKFTHRYYVLAAALGEAGVLCNDNNMKNAALWYVNTALPRQQSDGVNPEDGKPSVNYQSKGLAYAEYYFPYVTDATLRSKLITMIDKGLAWQSKYVDAFGKVNTSSPARTIGPSFSMGYTITGKPLYRVISTRMKTLY